ncbi:MAG TPA: Holliday junction resolvase RuvX [Thermoanaerobaculia bacterium]|nr:Holliday junction resolvase RuvX [Thermoanaerobaculia bacterium]
MRVLAVDFGEKRIGLAVSDETGRVVVPVGAVPRASDARAAALVARAAKERDVSRLVVGLPRNLDGSEGLVARRARSFARRLGEACGLPVDLHGEALTSVAAEAALDEAGIPARRRALSRDAEAAAVLLRDWLAARADGAA